MRNNTIQTITIIGANGVVGSGVARLLAGTNQVKTFLVSRSKECSDNTITKILAESKDSEVLGPMIACDYSSLSDCISESDWVFESVAEDLPVKLDVHGRINQAMGHDTIVSSGTSSYRIKELAQVYSEENKRQLFGTHIFNPPHKLTLLELIRTEWSDEGSADALHTFFTTILGRAYIEVKDVNGFLANRIGTLFLNEALMLAEHAKDRGGVGYIDAVIGPFTGRLMPPIMSIDYIGLDVFAKMMENIHRNLDDVISQKVILSSLKSLIASGHIGRKAGAGYYKTIANRLNAKERLILDLESMDYMPAREYDFPFSKRMIALQNEGRIKQSFKALAGCTDEEARLCKYLLLRYIAISYQIAREVAEDPADVDVVMEHGYNWLSPRKLVNLFGGSSGIRAMIETDGQLKSALSPIGVEMLDFFRAPLEEKDSSFFSIRGRR